MYEITSLGSMSITVGVDEVAAGEPLAQLVLFTILAHPRSTPLAHKSSTVLLSLSQSVPPTFSISPLMIVVCSSWSHLIISSFLEMSSTTPMRE